MKGDSSFKKTKKDNWVSPSLFANQYQKQLDKTYTFEKPTLPTKVELEKFIEFAINIACARISGSDKYLYILNSSDEGLTLRYNASDKDLRPKKSAIMILLKLTILFENLDHMSSSDSFLKSPAAHLSLVALRALSTMAALQQKTSSKNLNISKFLSFLR